MESGRIRPFEDGTAPLEYGVVNSSCRGAGAPEPTTLAQADSLVSTPERQQAIRKLDINGASVEAVLPALPGQEFQLANWLNSGRTLCEPTWAFRTKQAIDQHRLRGAWAVLRRRHPVLRSTLVATGPDDVFTVVLKQASGASNYATFRYLSPSVGSTLTLEQQVHDALKQLSVAPSSLSTPPVRLTLVHNVDEGDAVLLTVHHAAADGWTMELLFDELIALYRQKPILIRSPSFKNFVRDTLQSLDPEVQEEFWKEAIGGCDKTLLPEGISDAASLRSLCEVRVKGTRAKVSTLEAAADSAGVNVHAILCLAYARALADKTGTDRPIFGSFRSGRPRASNFLNLEGLFAPLSNMLPTAVPIAEEAKDKTALGEALKTIVEVRAKQEPFEYTYLRDSLRWAGFTHGQDKAEEIDVPFNTFFTIHWDDGKLQKPAASRDSQDISWERMDLGCSSPRVLVAEPKPGRTTVDRLDTHELIREHNAFIDVKPAQGGDSDALEFIAHSDRVLMNEKGLSEFVNRIDNEVAGVVDILLT